MNKNKPFMKNILRITFVMMLCSFLAGCGYTSKSLMPGHLRTLYVDHFKNNVTYTNERAQNIYYPLLELDVQKAIIDRFLFDGNLKIAKEDNADLILRGELKGYKKDVLRSTDNDDVEEYRITITISLVLWDEVKGEAFFEEANFSGETTYFVTGVAAKSESAAVKEAVNDIARRVVERTIENW